MRKTVAPISFLLVSNLAVAGCLVGCLTACVASPPPYDDYNIARAAMVAARDVDSAKSAPGLWNRADESYRLGQKEFLENDFYEAKKHFQLAIHFAEKAENATKLKRFQSGDAYP